MPIYEFVCQACRAELELLVGFEEKPACPECKHPKLERQLSVISSPSNVNGTPAPIESCGAPRCCGGGCQ